jgi:hypothetical protein
LCCLLYFIYLFFYHFLGFTLMFVEVLSTHLVVSVSPQVSYFWYLEISSIHFILLVTCVL